jgi:pSer/pThr/pTyr-binding forkhead associated (FHA) protein
MAILVMAFLSLASQFDERPAASVKLGGARIRIGRASDCDLRLPDLEVGLHHASLVRHGDGYALVDEGGPTSTWVGNVSAGGVMHPLAPHVPCPLKGLTSARIGPFWLVLDPKAPGPADSARARHLFTIELLVRKLRWLGYYPFSALLVREGPDKDAWFDLRTLPGLPRLVGRGHDADFQLRDPCTSRKHLEVMCDESVWVRDLNSSSGTRLGLLPLVPWKFVRWVRGTPLQVGRNLLVFESPLLDALEALERGELGKGAGGLLPGFGPGEGRPRLVVHRGTPPPAAERPDGDEADRGPVESTVRPRVTEPPPAEESPRPD